MIGLLFFITLISISYTLLIIHLSSGWKRIMEYFPAEEFSDVYVSIIIPFRNEENILGKSISAIESLNYPATHLDVIYINDHSDDRSLDILSPYLKKNANFRLISLDKTLHGKKAAILEAVKAAKGELLLFTDADCYPEAGWVKNMASFFKEKNPVMISGPVLIKDNQGIFNKLQELEFLSLTGSGAGSFGIGSPVMCSGANLGYDRKKYISAIGNIRSDVASGDDIFMMLYFKKRFPAGMFFLKSPGAVIYTEPMTNLKLFISQKMRWARKVRHYNDKQIILTGVIVFLINSVLIVLLAAGLFNTLFLLVFLLIIILKTIVDLTLLGPVCNFFRKKKLLGLLIPAQFFYILYSVFSAVTGSLLRPHWKGRKLTNG